MTTLESLANELLLDLFEYFDGVQLFYCFYALNSRFDALLKHFPHYHLNFQPVSQKNFHNLCEKFLPLISNRVISLWLSDESNGLRQTNLLISDDFSLRQFSQLKSLTLHCIRLANLVNKIVSDCLGLTHLALTDTLGCFAENRDVLDLNKIWSLPNLRYFRWENAVWLKDSVEVLTTTSFTLEYLMIKTVWCKEYDMARLIMHTPCLQRFRLDQGPGTDYNTLPYNVPQMIKLERLYVDTCVHNATLLQNMPNLCRLTWIAYRSFFMNGYQWENTITNYLPKLKVFRFEMHLRLQGNQETRVTELLDSFRGPFWTLEHQWFVRCHWSSDNNNEFIVLYTLPYGFHYFSLNSSAMKYKSTCPNDDEYNSYDRVHKLFYNAHVFPDFRKFKIIFPNIQHIDLQFYTNLQIHTIIPSLNKIRSIDISVKDRKSYPQILPLLSSINNLHRTRLIFGYHTTIERYVTSYYTIKINPQEADEQDFNKINDSRSYDLSVNWKTTVKNHSEMLHLVEFIINFTEQNMVEPVTKQNMMGLVGKQKGGERIRPKIGPFSKFAVVPPDI